MDTIFVGKGHGYETGSRGRCTAFDGFEIIAAPMGGTDAVFRCDYQSHSIRLAVRAETRLGDRPGDLYILMQHGGGREVLRIPTFYDHGEFREALLAMPEAVQYATLYTMYEIASQAGAQRAGETRREWGEAFLDGRIRRKRSRGRITLTVETPFERDLRTGKVSPTTVAIDVATGEVTPVDEPQAA
jgi:hypothetical protein